MSRRLTHLLRLTGELACEAPLCIGGLDALTVTDMPTMRDGEGRLVIPGTSLAGALFEALALEEGCDLRGAVDPKRGPMKASRIIIDDAAALTAIDTEYWDGVGIDRITGAAARRVKFDREVIPQGARFGFCMSCEVDDDLNEARRFMHRAKRRLERGLNLGSGITRGLGRVRLEKAHAIELDWANKDQILDWIDKGSPHLPDATSLWAHAASTGEEDAELVLSIHWRPSQPLMVKAAREGLATDILPFISRLADGTFALTLPGSGLKGALREHAERIIRTVLGIDPVIGAPLDELVAVDVVQELFGLARASTQQVGQDSGPGRGRLFVATTYAAQGRPRADWDRLADHPLTPPDMARAMHVAIDRWTGGAAESFLYSAAEPDPAPWQPIVLTYRPRKGDDEALHLALLWLVLEDLRQGRIALGFGKTRGYGAITIQRIECTGALVERYGLPATRDGNTPLLDNPPAALADAWRNWLDHRTQEMPA